VRPSFHLHVSCVCSSEEEVCTGRAAAGVKIAWCGCSPCASSHASGLAATRPRLPPKTDLWYLRPRQQGWHAGDAGGWQQVRHPLPGPRRRGAFGLLAGNRGCLCLLIAAGCTAAASSSWPFLRAPHQSTDQPTQPNPNAHPSQIEIKGLNVAFLDGRRPPKPLPGDEAAAAAAAAAPPGADCPHYTPADLEVVKGDLRDLAGDVDVLMTCEWPYGILGALPADQATVAGKAAGGFGVQRDRCFGGGWRLSWPDLRR
jgi:hypothetical protein